MLDAPVLYLSTLTVLCLPIFSINQEINSSHIILYGESWKISLDSFFFFSFLTKNVLQFQCHKLKPSFLLTTVYVHFLLVTMCIIPFQINAFVSTLHVASQNSRILHRSKNLCPKSSSCHETLHGIKYIMVINRDNSLMEYIALQLYICCWSKKKKKRQHLYWLNPTKLLSLLQTYLQSTTVRIEEMRVKRRDAEQWMSHRLLPESLRERIRRHEQYRWQETRGVNEENILRNLPKDLRRDIKRHLCLKLLMRVGHYSLMSVVHFISPMRLINSPYFC